MQEPIINLDDISLLEFDPNPLAHRLRFKLNPGDSKDMAIIKKIVEWLNTSELINDNEPPYGKHGYPPYLVIELKNGNSIFIEPAFYIYVSKNRDGGMSSTGSLIEGEILSDMNNKSTTLKRIRLKSPQLYNWLRNDWQNDIVLNAE